MRGERRRVLAIAAAVAVLLVAGALAEQHRLLVPLRFAVQRQRGLMPSTVLAPARDVQRGQPTLSLYVAEHDLYDPVTGILANPEGRGPEWERAGTVSYFDKSQLAFAEDVGVRVHGGGSRITSERQGFRLAVRKRYGGGELPGGALFGPAHAHPVRRLVVHNDVRRGGGGLLWHLVNPLAYDIAAAMGCIVSPTRPVRLLLNGEFQGVYVLSEYFHERHFFEPHWGYRVYFGVPEIEELWREIGSMRPLRMEAVGRLIDLDNLTRWFIAVVFCATGDAYQGPGQYLDRTRTTGQWFWITWDLDESFRDPRADSFQALLERIEEGRRGRRASEPRAHVLTTLLAEDANYREFFKRIWVDVMNHHVTEAFLRERFEYYRDIALAYGAEDTRYLSRLERFLQQRPAVVRALAEQWLNTPPSVRCSIVGRRSGVRLDGVPVEPGFQGYYFPGMSVELSVGAGERGALAYWRVNGQRHEATDAPLRVVADRDLEVEAVWR